MIKQEEGLDIYTEKQSNSEVCVLACVCVCVCVTVAFNRTDGTPVSAEKKHLSQTGSSEVGKMLVLCMDVCACVCLHPGMCVCGC